MNTAKRVIQWPDIDYGVRVWQENEAVLNFEIFLDPDFDEHGKPVDPLLAEPEMIGFIKFDGCFHWWLPDNSALHICGQEGLRELQEAQIRLFAEAGRVIASWMDDE